MTKFLHVLAIFGIIIGGIVVAVALFAALFLTLWKPFGGKPNRADRKDYALRAANYDGKHFHNEEDFDPMAMPRNPPADPLTFSHNGTRPDFAFPTKMPDFMRKDTSARAPVDEFTVTWFGHSSLLLQMHGMNILIDPVFSEMISPVRFVGSKRFSHPPVSVSDLPDIDLLILSHDHYDHLDYHVITAIKNKVRRFIVPLGVEKHLNRWGVAPQSITNMAWWEETSVDGLTIACTPAQHFSGRKLVDGQRTLWCSWVLKDDYHQIFENGDSGFNTHFAEIHDRYGDFDFALMECGQYDMQWPKVHMFPEQSVQATKTLGARVAMPIHWGAIVLSRHGWDDSVERYLRAAEKENLTVITPYIGETARIETPALYAERWWRRGAVSLYR